MLRCFVNINRLYDYTITGYTLSSVLVVRLGWLTDNSDTSIIRTDIDNFVSVVTLVTCWFLVFHFTNVYFQDTFSQIEWNI